MKEIGGYFGLDWFVNKPYHEDIVELNAARNALLYLLKAKKIKKIYIPYFLCNSVSNILERHLVEFEYYHIDKDFMPLFNEELKDHEYLYIVNYYGQLSNQRIIDMKERYENIIIDNVQSFYQRPISGIDTIYSCRKFFGVPDGSYLSTDERLKEVLEIDISKDRMKHILGRFEGKASNYYKDFRGNDESFKDIPLRKMSKLTRNILGAIDYENCRTIRNNNYKYLNERFQSSNKLNLNIPDGPFAYPYYIENGLEIKKSLIDKKAYIPTLWPNVINQGPKDCIEYDYAANILPLPCDHRYTLEDMEIMSNELEKYI